MNKTGTITVGAVVALLGAIGANATPIVEAIKAAWSFFGEAMAGAPLGTGSFLLSLVLAVVSQPFLKKWVPHLKCPLSRDFIIESAALVIATVTLWAQMQGLGAVQRLYALILGLIAGFCAPYVHKGIAALIGLAGRGARRWTGDA